MDKQKYNTIHQNRLRNKYKTGICDHCRKSKKTEWANISGKYSQSDDDWLELCKPCHLSYDYKKRYGKNRRRDNTPKHFVSSIPPHKVVAIDTL